MRFLLVAALVCLAQGRPEQLTAGFFQGGMIIGGQDGNIEDFPWQLSLEFGNSHTCGAILASADIAITAAHCVNGRNYNNFQVKAGMQCRDEASSGYQTTSMSSIVEHEDYTSQGGYPNDIALLFLQNSISFNSKVAPITQATGSELWTGRTCQASGWGRTGTSQALPQCLQYMDTEVITNAACDQGMTGVIGATILDSHICIRDPADSAGSCNGDSGGPLNCKINDNDDWTNTGVTSWVVSSGGNCRTDYPQVYTRVSSHESWISDNTGGALP